MKTLQQLYTEILRSDEMKKSFAGAAREGKTAEFLKTQGCEATVEEVQAFLREKSGEPLSDEELDNAAGGGCNGRIKAEWVLSVNSLGTVCAWLAIQSATEGYTGQKTKGDGRLCNHK